MSYKVFGKCWMRVDQTHQVNTKLIWEYAHALARTYTHICALHTTEYRVQETHSMFSSDSNPSGAQGVWSDIDMSVAVSRRPATK